MSRPSLTRFGVSIEQDLIRKFDRYIEHAGYGTRSEAIRDLIRARLVEEGIQDPQAPATGVLALVYDHHKRDLEDHLTALQHDHHELIIATTHVHLDHHNCLEVTIVKGRASQVRELAEKLIALRGDKNGNLTMSSTGGHLH